MNKNNIIITIKKELRSIFRDKKTLLMIFCFPFIISLLIFLYGFMDKVMFDSSIKNKLGVNYNVSIPEKEIMDKLSLEPIYFEDESKLKNEYEIGNIDAYVIYNKKENLYTVYSSNSNLTNKTVTSTINYLDLYNRYLGDMYIKGEDIDPEIVYNNFKTDLRSTDGASLSEKDMMLSMVMNMTFIYIIVSISIATINMATSAIAVEKENGTLETILTMPITIKELILGKYLATVIIGLFASLISFLVTIISFLIASNMFSIYEKFSVKFSSLIFGILICFAASFFIAALASIVTSSAKSYKEAQASGQILQIISIMPLILELVNFKMKTIYYLVPILNYSNILMDLYVGKISYINLFLTLFSTIIYSILLIYYLIKKFKSEKVLFGA